jgi:hypothetical protein
MTNKPNTPAHDAVVHDCLAVQELRNIVAANYRSWDEGFNGPEDFVLWAKNRARFTLNKIEDSPVPASEQVKPTTERVVDAGPINELLNIAQWMADNVNTGNGGPDDEGSPVSQFDYELSQAAHRIRDLAEVALRATTAGGQSVDDVMVIAACNAQDKAVAEQHGKKHSIRAAEYAALQSQPPADGAQGEGTFPDFWIAVGGEGRDVEEVFCLGPISRDDPNKGEIERELVNQHINDRMQDEPGHKIHLVPAYLHPSPVPASELVKPTTERVVDASTISGLEGEHLGQFVLHACRCAGLNGELHDKGITLGCNFEPDIRATTAGGQEELAIARKRFNRSIEVEQVLLDAANGKRLPPDPDECRKLAIKLGVPSRGE